MAPKKNRDDRANRSVTLSIGSLDRLPKASAVESAASDDVPPKKLPLVPKPTHSTLIMGTSPPRTPAEWATRPLPRLGNEPSVGRAPEPLAPPRPEGTRPLFTDPPGSVGYERLPLSDEDISRAIATFGPMDDCPAPVEASAASRSDITMEIEESDEVEIIAGDSAAEPSNGASPSVPQQLISDRSVKRDRLPPLDTRQARRKYRMIAAIIGLFLGGASFALVGLFLREGQEHFEKRKIAATSPVPVTAAPVVPQPVTAASSAPTPDPIPQPPQPPQPPVVDAAPQPEDRPIAIGDTVVIRLSGMAKGASVFVEGKEAELPLVVPRSRSIIKIEARAPGYRTVVKRIIPGSDKTVRMKMLSSSASSKKSSPKPSRPSTSSQWRPAGTHRKK